MKIFKLLLIPFTMIMINPELLFGNSNDSTVVLDSIAYRIWTDTTHYSMTQCCIPIYFEYTNISNDTLHLISASGNIIQLSFTSSSGIEYLHYVSSGTTHYNISPNDTLYFFDTASLLIEWTPGTYLARGRPDILNSELPYAEVPVIIQSYTNIDNNQNLPNQFKLMQNYPNPFNPVTTLTYQLPKSEFVNLSIYNVAGQLVKTLVNERNNAGFYSVQWNANNLSSGIYLYRLDVGEYTSVKKCILLK